MTSSLSTVMQQIEVRDRSNRHIYAMNRAAIRLSCTGKFIKRVHKE